jgi:hypothetical protein
MAGFELLKQVKRENAEAASEELDRLAAEVLGGTRDHGVPVDLWRLLKR